MPDQQAILCLAVTPAVQRTQFLATLMPGEVNRIRRTLVTASGKGVNVALALHQLGGTPRLIGFRGGDSGRFIADEMVRQGIDARWIEMAEPTRHCHTLIETDHGRVTELVEEAAPPSPLDWDKFNRLVKESLPGCRWLAISGSLPPGAPPQAWLELCRGAVNHGVRICIDSQGAPLLHMLETKPALVKLNAEELQRTCGLSDASAPALFRGAGMLMERGAEAVLVTNGAHTSHLFEGARHTALQPPAIRLVNPIGSGDCVTAGMLHALVQGQPLAEAAWLGIVCGSANAETETPALTVRAGAGCAGAGHDLRA